VTRVFIVGAGPGDPDLLTVKAVRILQQAHVVLHDALVSAEVLALISPEATVINVGKRCGEKSITQERINSLMLQYAAKRLTVVRLKGGDPTIFGRTGEEIETLQAAGIAYEIVPGITAAVAAAAAGGISLTDRRFASSVVFTTAHHGGTEEAINWGALAASRSTFAVYMPGNYAEFAMRLREAGLSLDTSCLIVSCAGLPNQQLLRTTLRHMGNTASPPSPSLLIIGECATGPAQ
jgi:uroporphyrin-III C-methyltransferase